MSRRSYIWIILASALSLLIIGFDIIFPGTYASSDALMGVPFDEVLFFTILYCLPIGLLLLAALSFLRRRSRQI